MGEESKHEVKHIFLGILVVALTALLFLLSYDSGPREEAQGYLLSARFNATDGIGIGSDVVLTGIKVGEVISREYDVARQNVLVKMDIQNATKVPYESTISIVSDGLLGPKYAKIEPGGSEENMKSGLVLRPPWAVLGRSWSLLGRTWADLGTQEGPKGGPRDVKNVTSFFWPDEEL